MKTILGKMIGFGLLALAVSACGGSSGNNTALYSNTAAGQQTGSTSVASGNIGFAGNATIGQTYILAGNFPTNNLGLGNYGVLSAGSSLSGGQAFTQLTPKTGVNGSIQINANQNSIYGTLQLSQSNMQSILQAYGPNAQVTSLAIWATYLPELTNSQTYSYTTKGVIVYLYINGAYQPYGPIDL